MNPKIKTELIAFYRSAAMVMLPLVLILFIACNLRHLKDARLAREALKKEKPIESPAK